MSSQTVDVEIDSKTTDALMRLTKAELAEKFVISVLESKVLETENTELKTKLDKAESYVEQGRAMLEAVMNRWYEYDT